MSKPLQIGIMGDFKPELRSHVATNEALQHAGGALGRTVHASWIPTASLRGGPEDEATLRAFDGLWAAPGSPYQHKEGALAAIRFARERNRPFVGT